MKSVEHVECDQEGMTEFSLTVELSADDAAVEGQEGSASAEPT